MLDSLISALNTIIFSIQENFFFIISIVIALWLIQFFNTLVGYRLNMLGIYPRTWHGLIGIPFAPFLHGSYSHLFFNTIPFIVLGSLLLIKGKSFFLFVSLFIILVSGLATWAFSRRAIHVGASSVILGYWGFLLFNAYEERSPMAFILAFLCVYYFGWMVFNLLPTEEKISWEGHVFGFLSGVLASLLAHDVM